ncbi:MAG: pentapeptide repeat-containing protein, partial [Acidobacteriota bacterium]
MANPEHLKLLKEAVADEDLRRWNSWIEFHWHADLSGAALSQLGLSNISLFESDLRGANFNGSSLVRAHLRASDFTGT